MDLTKEQRDALPDSAFAIPAKRLLPLVDERHVLMAANAVASVGGASEAERATGWHSIYARAAELGIADKVLRTEIVAFEAMAIVFPDAPVEHPNKLPFTGILTRVDRPSDNPPGGSSGHRVIVPSAVARAALPGLLGMAVNYSANFSSHDVTQKIGIITAADIEGDALRIAGFFYAADFPDVVRRIQAEKERLGFSYEAQARIRSLDEDPWYVELCVFTGAALLYKDKAAYTSTSVAAQAEQETKMDKEIEAALAEITKGIGAVASAQTAQGAALQALQARADAATKAIATVKTHADGMRSLAAAMETAGIGTDAAAGHVGILRAMAAQMEAEAAAGTTPTAFVVKAAAAVPAAVPAPELKALTDSLASLTTMVTDLKAKAFTAAAEPARKTLSPEVKELLAKAGITEDDAQAGKLTVQSIDKTLAAGGIVGVRAIEAKLKMQQAGLLKVA